ncbi:MAG: hypothetical protein KKD28_09945 [Chloroflexi bacterium]|nr:hypothetical protein [Chloroflexota bacterium]
MDTTQPTIVLLGPRGAGKTAALLSALGWLSSPAYACMSPFLPQEISRIGLCSKQGLLQSHLTARENMQFAAGLHGLSGQVRINTLIERSGLEANADQPRAYTLPRTLRRTLQLLIALLPDPDLLLIDDITAGLSLPARRKIWQSIITEQNRRTRTIFYATRDLEAGRVLGDEVWLIEDGRVQRKWLANELPDLLRASAGFAIELKSSTAAQRFFGDVAKLDFVRSTRVRGSRTVEVFVTEGSDTLTLTWMAGLDLAVFQSLPLEIDHLPEGWWRAGTGSSPPELGAGGRVEAEALFLSAILEIALSEWRRHFRSFWKAGNLLLSGVWLLASLELIAPTFENLPDFMHTAPLPLLLSSAMILGLGMETLSRLAATGEMETLFQPAQSKSATLPLSLLAVFDLATIGRRGLLLGLSLGQSLVLAAHAWPLLLFVWAVFVSFPQAPLLLVASAIFWLLTALVSLALTVLTSTLIQRPGWGIWLGWLGWLLAVVSSQLPSGWEPYVWFWPLSGYAAAFERSLEPQRALMPLGFALLGTALLCWLAERSFRLRSAVWSAKKK